VAGAVAVSRPSASERAAGELLIRERARESLVDFAAYIDIPGAPALELPEDFDFTEDVVFAPIESKLVKHHRVILEEVQRCMETEGGRLMIIAPPGSAKSTMADVVAPPWAMGKWPGYRILLTSYATRLARKHGRRALQLAKSRRYSGIWKERPAVRSDQAAAHEWALDNGSEFMAAGILAGITGNRANGAICDDVIAGREEAESPTIRAKTMEAYRDDVESRLLPGGWIVFINTRWHQDDPCGQILPDDYDGRSGDVVCKDGRTWRVLNMPAKAERADDPVGRPIGTYLWPEWFPPSHWQALENDPSPGGQRRWQGLYQGRPMSGSGDDFDKADALWYDSTKPFGTEDARPKALELYGASDFAVTDPEDDLKAAGRVDWTEHGVFGMDDKGDLWLVDWWSGQKETDVAVDAMLNFVPRYKPAKWWNEGGTIDKAIRPALRRRMRERSNEKVNGRTTSYFVSVDTLPSIADKRAKCQSFAARYQARTVHFPRDKAWSHQVLDQLVNLGAARHDDKADVCGLIGRGIDAMLEARKPPAEREKGPKPFTAKWIEYQEPKPGPRYR
jgi:phage terminase large subunit-like protein